jgi:hypothetical protein
MSIETERVEHFVTWRDARRTENYTLCENCMKDLLTTLSKYHEEIKIKLQHIYNHKLKGLIDDLNITQNEYKLDKRLSKGFTAHAIQNEMRRLFWDELYDIFYIEFINNSLFPSYTAEGGL